MMRGKISLMIAPPSPSFRAYCLESDWGNSSKEGELLLQFRHFHFQRKRTYIKKLSYIYIFLYRVSCFTYNQMYNISCYLTDTYW
jgi:hypothetical protein